ncbi:MAG: EcsC family protein [Wenzhouxiangellaceae bacterium]|nr:EcsC family protein [Wenzhouxiangellaceae bacterium]
MPKPKNTTIASSELEQLRRARVLLDNPGLAARISDLAGAPIERSFQMLPERWYRSVQEASRKTIETALEVALGTMDTETPGPASSRWHTMAATTAGAAGGAFGLAALALELPVSTTIMLRSIADIARSEGEDLRLPEARLACLQVLALGGSDTRDDAAETGYFTVRAAMARTVSECAAHVARKGLIDKSAPVIVRLISQIASRFSIVVSQKAAAQSIPIAGAIGGAAVNALFIDHFQNMARGHFIIRRLERTHGAEKVRMMLVEPMPEYTEPARPRLSHPELRAEADDPAG